jgi:hypothetical protein
MTRRSIVFRAGLLLVLAYAAGAAAQGDLEVTMRVLDDVSDIDAVIIAIGNDDTEAAADEADRGRDAAEAEAPVEDRAVPPAEPDAADELAPDDEDGSEGGLEDRDVVEDPAPEPAI